NELRGHVKDQRPFVVGNLRARHRGCIPGRLKPVLPLLSPLEEIPDADIELRLIVQVVETELARLDNGKNCVSQDSVGFGRRFAVISCAWFWRMVERAANSAWL